MVVLARDLALHALPDAVRLVGRAVRERAAEDLEPVLLERMAERFRSGDGPRAQERVLIAQVGREIQANLRRMEQVLDAFFRDNGKRAELATLTKDSQQIRGALAILGLEDAERLLASCQEQIELYANPETAVNNDDLESLAEALSGLGFYIEAVEQQRPDRERLIAPLLAINFADDIINPPELGILEREIKRVPHGRAVTYPASERTAGHGTHTMAAVWKDELIRLLKDSAR